jgi:streptogramin lyase
MHQLNLRAAALAGAAAAVLGGSWVYAQAQPAAEPPMVKAYAGRPGVAAGDYNVNGRTAADEALPNPYARDETFFKIPKDMTLGSVSGIGIDKDGKSIWIAQRCGGSDVCIDKGNVDVLWKFDEHGNVVKHFGGGAIVYAHGLYVAPDGNIWVTDLQSNVDLSGQPGNFAGRNFPPGRKPNGAQVLKFSPEGKLLMTLGTPGVYGTDNAHFSQPSAVAVDKEGNVYVGDGHDSKPANNRIMKFDKTGKFLMSWPTCQPSEKFQIDCSHALALDSTGSKLFVGNRGNSVIDIFDAKTGKFLETWKQFGKPSGLYIDANDVLYSADSESSVKENNAYIRGVHVGDAKTGAVKAFIPDVLGNPVPWFPLRGTTGSEGVAAAGGAIFTSQVTPYGLAKYTMK